MLFAQSFLPKPGPCFPWWTLHLLKLKIKQGFKPFPYKLTSWFITCFTCHFNIVLREFLHFVATFSATLMLIIFSFSHVQCVMLWAKIQRGIFQLKIWQFLIHGNFTTIFPCLRDWYAVLMYAREWVRYILLANKKNEEFWKLELLRSKLINIQEYKT